MGSPSRPTKPQFVKTGGEGDWICWHARQIVSSGLQGGL